MSWGRQEIVPSMSTDLGFKASGFWLNLPLPLLTSQHLGTSEMFQNLSSCHLFLMLAHKTQHPLSVPNFRRIFAEYIFFPGKTLLTPGLGEGVLQVVPPTWCPCGNGNCGDAWGLWSPLSACLTPLPKKGSWEPSTIVLHTRQIT